MILSPVKYQPDGSNVTEMLPKSSWNTHINNSKPYMFISQEMKKPPYGFCTHLQIFHRKHVISYFNVDRKSVVEVAKSD